MNQSEQINELAAALCLAQAEIEGAVKDSKNPFYKSQYADLTSVIDAVKVPLATYGLSISQMTDFDDQIEFVETQIMHKSGQWIRGRLPIKSKDATPQAMGSGISYARRYALQAALNVPAVDDDEEGAQNRSTQKLVQSPNLIISKLAEKYTKPENAIITAQEVFGPETVVTSKEQKESNVLPVLKEIRPIQAAQVFRINQLITKTKSNVQQLHAYMKDQWGALEIAKLTEAQAQTLIEMLQKKAAQ